MGVEDFLYYNHTWLPFLVWRGNIPHAAKNKVSDNNPSQAARLGTRPHGTSQ